MTPLLLNLYAISNETHHPTLSPNSSANILNMSTENGVVCLVGAMDRLWFHRTILFSEPSVFLSPEMSKTPLPTSHSPHCMSNNSSQVSLISEQDVSSDAFVITVLHEDESSSPECDHDKEKANAERRKKSNHSSRKNRNHSSSPISAKKQSRNLGYSSARRLRKSTSCKSLSDLEIEEVKGFMDLGFVFEKENLSRDMMSLIPGLQRIGDYKTYEGKYNVEVKDDFEDEEEERIMRPYLSEAWIVKRPDSPLLNLKIPTRVSAATDMKKHLKYWARMVASAIQQES